MPPQPLPGSIATASTLAFALVYKYVDGTPPYRVAQIFERAGVPIECGALGALGHRLEREASIPASMMLCVATTIAFSHPWR